MLQNQVLISITLFYSTDDAVLEIYCLTTNFSHKICRIPRGRLVLSPAAVCVQCQLQEMTIPCILKHVTDLI
jgi:hypothetical protein